VARGGRADQRRRRRDRRVVAVVARAGQGQRILVGLVGARSGGRARRLSGRCRSGRRRRRRRRRLAVVSGVVGGVLGVATSVSSDRRRVVASRPAPRRHARRLPLRRWGQRRRPWRRRRRRLSDGRPWTWRWQRRSSAWGRWRRRSSAWGRWRWGGPCWWRRRRWRLVRPVRRPAPRVGPLARLLRALPLFLHGADQVVAELLRLVQAGLRRRPVECTEHARMQPRGQTLYDGRPGIASGGFRTRSVGAACRSPLRDRFASSSSRCHAARPACWCGSGCAAGTSPGRRPVMERDGRAGRC